MLHRKRISEKQNGFYEPSQIFYCIDRIVPARSNADRQLHATQSRIDNRRGSRELASNLLSVTRVYRQGRCTRDTAAVAACANARANPRNTPRAHRQTTMLAARRRPGKLPEGFYAAAEKEADRAMHTAVRKESRPRPRPLERNKTDWSHAKIKIGPRHQASLPRLDRRRPPAAEEELRRGLGPTAHAEALTTLRRYDQGLLSEKQVARAMDRLFARGRDDELRDAFRYFLPAELAV